VNFKSSESASKFYPSVDCGPIDISKAHAFLGWNPTPLVKAITRHFQLFKSLIFWNSLFLLLLG